MAAPYTAAPQGFYRSGRGVIGDKRVLDEANRQKKRQDEAKETNLATKRQEKEA